MDGSGSDLEWKGTYGCVVEGSKCQTKALNTLLYAVGTTDGSGVKED